MKKCISCGETKEDKQFYKTKDACRQCIVLSGRSKTNKSTTNGLNRDRFMEINGKQVF